MSMQVQAMTIRDRTSELNVDVINPSIIEPMKKASFKTRIQNSFVKTQNYIFWPFLWRLRISPLYPKNGPNRGSLFVGSISNHEKSWSAFFFKCWIFESEMKDGFENRFKMHQTPFQIDAEKSKSTTTDSNYFQTFTSVLKFSSWILQNTA